MPVDRFLRTFPFFLDCWVVWAAGSHSIDFETSGFGVRTIAKFLNHWLGDVTIAKFSFAVICPDPGKITNPGHCSREWHESRIKRQSSQIAAPSPSEPRGL